MFLVLDEPASRVAKVSAITRCFAKAIDLGITVLLAVLILYPLGVLLAFAYTLLHDGVSPWKGQSIGKRALKLRVVELKDMGPCTPRESAVRNAPIAVAVLFALIPFWGWIILLLLGIPLILLEIYLMVTLENGGRLGDVMADTKVTDFADKVR